MVHSEQYDILISTTTDNTFQTGLRALSTKVVGDVR